MEGETEKKRQRREKATDRIYRWRERASEKGGDADVIEGGVAAEDSTTMEMENYIVRKLYPPPHTHTHKHNVQTHLFISCIVE